MVVGVDDRVDLPDALAEELDAHLGRGVDQEVPRREFQEDFNQRKYEEQAALVERANKVIKQIFDQERYDLIVQEAVFVGPRVDITDKVIRALNAQAGK